jgi:hypothetical protein
MDPKFLLVYSIHLIIWIFVLVAFLNPKTAFINLFILIPLIYICHALFPKCVLSSIEEKLEDDSENKIKTIKKIFKPLKHMTELQKKLKKTHEHSPLSMQGILILGAITSAYALKRKYNMKMSDL